jgi:hypothetical protein
MPRHAHALVCRDGFLEERPRLLPIPRPLPLEEHLGVEPADLRLFDSIRQLDGLAERVPEMLFGRVLETGRL